MTSNQVVVPLIKFSFLESIKIKLKDFIILNEALGSMGKKETKEIVREFGIEIMSVKLLSHI